jgi:hypothetical protein
MRPERDRSRYVGRPVTRDEAKQYFERYAYQSRHGSELAADMVFEAAMIEIARVRSEALEECAVLAREECGPTLAARIRALDPKGAAGR